MHHGTPSSVSASETAAPLGETAPEEDAFFQSSPVATASVTDLGELDGRTDATVKIRQHETRRSWMVTGLVALMAPLLLLAVVIGMGRLGARSSTEVRAARVHVVDDVRTDLALATVTRVPLAMTQPASQGGPRYRAARSHRSGR